MTAMMAESLRKHAEKRMQFATDRFDSRIREIDVRLIDANGPRGGVDKICRVTATLRSGLVVFAEDRQANFFAAINRAAKRLRSLVSKKIAARRARRNVPNVE